MAQTWKELAEKTVGREKQIRIGSVDCTVNEDICKKHSIHGYPTLLLFKNGDKFKDYQNTRELEDFLNFIESNLVHEDL